MVNPRRLIGVLIVSVVLTAAPLTVAGASKLKSHLLSLNNLPSGWSVTHKPSKPTGGIARSKCFSALLRHGKKDKDEASVAFDSSGALLGESIRTGKVRWMICTF